MPIATQFPQAKCKASPILQTTAWSSLVGNKGATVAHKLQDASGSSHSRAGLIGHVTLCCHVPALRPLSFSQKITETGNMAPKQEIRVDKQTYMYTHTLAYTLWSHFVFRAKQPRNIQINSGCNLKCCTEGGIA